MGRNLHQTTGTEQSASSTKQVAIGTKSLKISRWAPVAPWNGVGTLNSHLRGPLSPRSAHFPPALGDRGARWDEFDPDHPVPPAARNGPPPKGPKCRGTVPDGSETGARRNRGPHSWQGCLFVVVCLLFCPQVVPVSPWCPFGSSLRPVVRN